MILDRQNVLKSLAICKCKLCSNITTEWNKNKLKEQPKIGPKFAFLTLMLDNKVRSEKEREYSNCLEHNSESVTSEGINNINGRAMHGNYLF